MCLKSVGVKICEQQLATIARALCWDVMEKNSIYSRQAPIPS
jgi:hypothetical protein